MYRMRSIRSDKGGNMGRQRNILLAVISAAAGIGVLCAPVSFSYIPSQVYAAQSEQTAQTERTEQAEPADQTGPAEQAQQTEAELSSMVASDDERAAQTLVGPEGCYAKYADEIEEGVYEIDADSSSSMFKIVKAELTVKDGDMSAVITLSGKGYLRLFMGTGMEAVKADPSSYAEFQEDADGAYTYEIPVEALDKTLECTGFSKRKEKWYDHQICFMTSSLPEGAVKDPIEDGEYSCDVTLTGGTGKASVESPAKLTVEDDLVFASIIWSSPNYDYMKVGGRQYLPVNESGNSEFSIPVNCFGEEMAVIADTTAMSEPHEIVYTLNFRKDSMKPLGENAGVGEETEAEDGASLTEAEEASAQPDEGAAETEAAPADSAYFVPQECEVPDGLMFQERLETEYARCFSVDRCEGDLLLITLPEDKKILVVPDGSEVPDGLPEDIIVFQQPADNIYLVASAAADMVDAIGGVDAVGYCGLEADDWCVEGMKDAVENGSVLYAGKYSAPDYELLTAGGCRLAIENTMIAHTPEVMEKLQELGIPVVIDYSSYEPSPLGRMEWVKFYGALTGHMEEAQSVFDEQKAQAAGLEETGRTVAFFYIRDDGAVVVRRSDDYVPEMIRMAGGEYVPNDEESDDHLGTAPMQMEAFYAAARDADYIVYNGTTSGEIHSIEELLARSSLMEEFAAVQQGHVYAADRNMYQKTMSLGSVVADLHRMMTGAPDEELQYLEHLS